MAVDLVAVGAGCLVGGGALIALFIHLRSHAEKFHTDGRDQHIAMKSRLMSQFFLEYLTKSVQQIDNILKRNPEFAEVRRRLIKAMDENQDTSEALAAAKTLIERVPPTKEEHDQLKDLTEELTTKFSKSEELSKLFKSGSSAEEECSGVVLKVIVCLFGLGFLIMAYSVVGDSFEVGAIAIGVLLIFIIAILTMSAMEKYGEAHNAQLKFNAMVDDELYSLPSLNANSPEETADDSQC